MLLKRNFDFLSTQAKRDEVKKPNLSNLCPHPQAVEGSLKVLQAFCNWDFHKPSLGFWKDLINKLAHVIALLTVNFIIILAFC